LRPNTQTEVLLFISNFNPCLFVFFIQRSCGDTCNRTTNETGTERGINKARGAIMTGQLLILSRTRGSAVGATGPRHVSFRCRLRARYASGSRLARLAGSFVADSGPRSRFHSRGRRSMEAGRDREELGPRNMLRVVVPPHDAPPRWLGEKKAGKTTREAVRKLLSSQPAAPLVFGG
jgi:hypothetical protein